MWEFYGIMSATNQAGMTTEDNIKDDMQNKIQLQKVHDEYLTRFKFICEEMETKFFPKSGI